MYVVCLMDSMIECLPKINRSVDHVDTVSLRYLLSHLVKKTMKHIVSHDIGCSSMPTCATPH